MPQAERAVAWSPACASRGEVRCGRQLLSPTGQLVSRATRPGSSWSISGSSAVDRSARPATWRAMPWPTTRVERRMEARHGTSPSMGAARHASDAVTSAAGRPGTCGTVRMQASRRASVAGRSRDWVSAACKFEGSGVFHTEDRRQSSVRCLLAITGWCRAVRRCALRNADGGLGGYNAILLN